MLFNVMLLHLKSLLWNSLVWWYLLFLLAELLGSLLSHVTYFR